MALNQNSEVAAEPNQALAIAVGLLRNLRVGIGALVLVAIIVGVIVTGPA